MHNHRRKVSFRSKASSSNDITLEIDNGSPTIFYGNHQRNRSKLKKLKVYVPLQTFETILETLLVADILLRLDGIRFRRDRLSLYGKFRRFAIIDDYGSKI